MIRKPVTSPVIPGIPQQASSESTAQQIPRIRTIFINLTGDILTVLTTTSHDSVFLRADNSLIDMNYITSFTGMTDKWFYKLISEGHFPKPIKLGRSSRWYKREVEQWK